MATTIICDNTTGSPIGDFTGTIDTYLNQTAPTTARGNNSSFEITKWTVNDHSHGMLAFTGLSNITPPVTVTSVTLGIYLQSITGSVTYDIAVRQVLRNWVELQATWNEYSTGNSWTTAGALSDGNDRNGTVIATISSVGDTLQYYTVVQTSGGLVTLVQDWINGGASNFGIQLIRADAGEDLRAKVFTSKSGTNGQRPYLSVTTEISRPMFRGS